METDMRIEQYCWTQENGWSPNIGLDSNENVQLIMVFGAASAIKETGIWLDLKKRFPKAHFFGCSTAGEICNTRVFDHSAVATCIEFERSRFMGAKIKLDQSIDSFLAGEKLANTLDQENLRHVFVLSDGLHVNGSELVRGLIANLPEDVTVTGGLAGDGARFMETYVFWDGLPEKQLIAAVGLYGSSLKIGYGSMGGWDPFGPERVITRSQGNVLFELDGQSALGIYKKYLGEHAQGLPAAGLLFPLSIRTRTGEEGIVRTILAVSEEHQSMTFAGDIPQGAYARFMKANFERLIDGSQGAAIASAGAMGSVPAELAVLVSCVGRKLVLKQRIEEEVEAVCDILGKRTCLAGFYSYGEISPFMVGAKSALHNQTMTITTMAES
jgi:hypothetical protein